MMFPLEIVLGAVLSGTITYCVAVSTVGARYRDRLHAIELRVATLQMEVGDKFITKEDFNSMTNHMEAHMIRIEDKLDTVIVNGFKRESN